MAERPVFISIDRAPYVKTRMVSFEWNGGFALSQSRKNIRALHGTAGRLYPDLRILEISSKSEQEEGPLLSAFHLMKQVPSQKKEVPLECVFQGGKVFLTGGPYTDLLEQKPKDAKRDPRLRSSGPLTGFRFEGKDYPLNPKTVFYDWMYVQALLEHPELKSLLEGYDAFTDIVFNPQKSLNCQAESAARFCGLVRAGRMDALEDFDTFLGTYYR